MLAREIRLAVKSRHASEPILGLPVLSAGFRERFLKLHPRFFQLLEPEQPLGLIQELVEL